MPYISDIDREYSDRSGFFGPNFSTFGQSVFFTTGRMTSGFSGDAHGSKGAIKDYLSGMHSDVMTMRKMAGVTMPSRLYSSALNMMGSTGAKIRSFAPTLGHLLPSKYMTLWSALSGNTAAMETMGMESAIHKLSKMSHESLQRGIRSGRVSADADMPLHKMREKLFGGKKGMFSFRRGMSKSPLDIRLSDVLGEGVGNQWTLRQYASHQAQGLKRAFARGATDEAIASGLSSMNFNNPVTRFMAKHIPKSAALKAAGRAIPVAFRAAGIATLGIDAGHMALGAGKLAGKAFIGAIQIPTKIYQSATEGFHRGTFMSSSPMSPFVGATSRQRAMANIYEKQLNLSQVMGNEASYFASQWM